MKRGMKVSTGIVALAMALLASPVHAQSTSVRSSIVPASLLFNQVPAASSDTEWQRQYDVANQRRQAGKKKMLIGGGLFAGGLVVLVASVGKADYTNYTYSEPSGGGLALGYLLALGGSGIGTWGVIQWHDAANKMSALELQKATPRATLMEFGAHQSIGLTASARPSLTYRVAW